MSDESTIMPDSSSLSHGDMDSQDATRLTGDEGAETGVIDTAPQGTPDVKGEDSVVAKRLSDTEAALKERQREFTELSLKMAELRGEVNASRKPEAPPEDPMANVLTAEMKERFSSDPASVLAEALQRQQQAFAKVLQARDDYQRTEMAKLVDERVNPERVALQGTISQLSKQAWFSRLTASEQVQAAKDYQQAAGGGGETPPGGGLGGTNRRSSPSTKTAAQERAEIALATMQAVFPHDETFSLEPTLSVAEKRR